MAKLMYDGQKWKSKVKGLINAIQAMGYKFAVFYKDDKTIAVMATARGNSDVTRKVISRGVAQCNMLSDEYSSVVGRYYALKRAFEASVRKRNGDKTTIKGVPVLHCGYKSQYRVKPTKDEMAMLKRKFEPRKQVQV